MSFINKVPIAHCPKCGKLQPINITKLVHKKKKLECDLGCCVVCDTVLNLDKDLKIKYVDEKWLKTRGWELSDETILRRLEQ